MRLGTRGSALALAQAQQVATLLGRTVEIVEVTTTGDREAGVYTQDKAKWVKELEVALLEGTIDLAVHSAKDVPAELPDGLALVAAPPREDPHDALCGAPSLETLAPGARVGTSSLRRTAQLRSRREDVEIVELRGNVDTRLAKLAAGECEAIVLALAGLRRLGRTDAVGGVLDLVPAAGQGTLVLEARDGDAPARECALRIADPETMAGLTAERALVRTLKADCHTPVGAYALREPGGGWSLEGWVGSVDGSAWVHDAQVGDEPEALGIRVGERLLAAGARELLGR